MGSQYLRPPARPATARLRDANASPRVGWPSSCGTSVNELEIARLGDWLDVHSDVLVATGWRV